MILLHISDTHFGTVVEAVREALLRFARLQKPDIVLLSGDITQRARRGQFVSARHFIWQLACPVLAVPGNHDIPLFNLLARWLHPYGNYRAVLGEDLEPEFENDSLLLVGVNTTRAARHKNGEVSQQQIARVTRRLHRARPGQLRVVMQHHPVRAVEESDVSNLLIGRERAVPAWVDAGMDILLAGHIHLPYVRPLQGATGRKGWTVQAGTALSRRIRGAVPNSVNLIRYEQTVAALPGSTSRGRCVLERWDYAQAAAYFVRVEAGEIELAQ
ncbi:MAG: metallophosphoesterase [Halioglobus sp.]|nr:metallophosphoesterase [Halioglobus sp.]